MKEYDFVSIMEEVAQYETKPVYKDDTLNSDLLELYNRSGEKEWLHYQKVFQSSGSFSRRQAAALISQFLKFGIPTDNLLKYYYEREIEPFVKQKQKRDLRSLL